LGFEFAPLDEVPERLRVTGPPFVAITFDDGYRDTVTHALPILRHHSAPFTVFLTTRFADRTGQIWWLELEEALARLDRVSVSVDGRQFVATCGTASEKTAAFETLYWCLRSGREDVLRTVVRKLAVDAGIDTTHLLASLCLSWEDIAALADEPLVSFGAHTVSHPMLRKWPISTAQHEIAASRDEIARRTGRRVRHFAYPVGDRESAGPREFALTREAGFATAVTTRPGHLFRQHAAYLHALPRVSINGAFQSQSACRAMLSGVPFLVWNRGRRLVTT
jgi:peptidoglycan/xylan/chitin deacetylase (PgdA/CDA1 family)